MTPSPTPPACRRVSGPLAPYADAFREHVRQFGYTAHSVEWQVWGMARLSQWMTEAGVRLDDLTEAHVDAFVRHHRQHYKQVIGWRRLGPLLDYLRDHGMMTASAAPARSPWATPLATYAEFLQHHRHLAPRTIAGHCATARRLLEAWAPGPTAPNLRTLTATDVTTFLLAESRRLTPGAAQNVVNQLRTLLRFWYQTGILDHDLHSAIPPVASWHGTRLLPIVSPETVEVLYRSCDRTTTIGQRDYAIVLLLARLGLRAIEVSRLALDDLDWRAGTLVVRGKGGYTDSLPLPPDVGAAMADYLRNGRPQIALRALFLTVYAPVRGMTSAAVSEVVRQACRRSQLAPMGSHRLRHAFATTLLQQGAALPMIAQALRHRDLASTSVYAKVDRAALRTVAQDWPEGVVQP